MCPTLHQIGWWIRYENVSTGPFIGIYEAVVDCSEQPSAWEDDREAPDFRSMEVRHMAGGDIISNQYDGSGNHLPRFLLALRLGRSFSAPLPLLRSPLPLFPAPVLPLKARPEWLLPSETHESSLSAMIAG